MVDQLSLADFVHAPGMQSRLAALPSMQVSPPRCLLYGPARSGKTSLLFQLAFSLASRGSEVWLLADRDKLDQAPPLMPLATDRGHEAFSRMKFKYVQDLQQLKKFGACLHLLAVPPAALLVDDLAGLLANSRIPDKKARDAELNKALAFLIDGLEQLREQRGTDVLLVVSDVGSADGSGDTMSASGAMGGGGGSSSSGGAGLLYLLQRWFPVILGITGGGSGQVWTLQVAASRRQAVPDAAGRAAVNYRLTQSYLHVESVSPG